MKKEITTSVIINGTKEAVWQVLIDFEKYEEWNPFITCVEGDVIEGNQIKVKLQGMTFKPTVLVLNKYTEFKWLGHLLFKGIFDGEHRFLLEDNKNGTITFRQSEKFKGLLIRLFSNSLDNDTKNGFDLMNQALKKRVESL